MATDPLALRPYLRVSQTSNGDVSPDEQHKSLARDCDTQGWSMHPEPYRDLGSASRYARTTRDDYQRLIDDLRDGRFDAQILGLWESSRGSRRVGEWATLVDLLDDAGVQVWVHTHRRLYDPSNARDRRAIFEDAVDSEYESSKTSERLRRSHASRAEQGRAAGRLSYGYRRSYDPETGELLGRVPAYPEAEHVAELFERFAAGESIRSIENDWHDRGIVNRVGNPFRGAQLVEMLRNRVYISERAHVPGETTRWWKARDRVLITTGAWEPLVSRETFFRVQGTLDDPSRKKTRPGGARHLLSMILTCGVCGRHMSAIQDRRRARIYRCARSGCVSVSADETDDFVTEVVLSYLSRPDVYEALQQVGEGQSDQLVAARGEVVELEAHHRSMKTSLASRRMSVSAFEEIEPQILADLEAARARVRGLETPPALRGLLAPGDDVRARWEELPDIAARREIMRVVLSPALGGQARVMPTPARGYRVPAGERIGFLSGGASDTGGALSR